MLTNKSNKVYFITQTAVERVIDAEGISQFRYHITNVFSKRASEGFYEGIDEAFRKLYRLLDSPSSTDAVIIVCMECWLKMCNIGGEHHTSHSIIIDCVVCIVSHCLKSPRNAIYCIL